MLRSLPYNGGARDARYPRYRDPVDSGYCVVNDSEEETAPSESAVLIGALARGTGTNLAGYAVKSLLIFAHGVLAARIYGAQRYGIYIQGLTVMLLAAQLGQLGLDRTLTHHAALYLTRKDPKNLKRTILQGLSVGGLASIAIGILLATAAPLLARLFGEPELRTAFRFFALALPLFNISSLLAAFTQGFRAMRPTVLAVDIVGPGAELILILLFGTLGWKSVGLALAYTGAFAVAGIVLVIETRRLLSGIDFRDVIPAERKPVTIPLLFRFAFPILAIHLLQNTAGRVNTLLLGALGTSAMTGIFSATHRLASLGNTFLVSSNLMLAPMVSSLVEKKQLQSLGRLYQTTARWALMLSTPVFLMMASLSYNILLIFGPEFTAGTLALTILALTMIFNIATGSCGTILMMAGYPRYNALNELFKLVLVIGFSLWSIPRWGLIGAALTLAVGIVVVNSLRVVQVWHHLRIHPFTWSTLWIMGAGFVLTLVLAGLKRLPFFQHGSIWPLLLGIIVGGKIYGAIIFAIAFDPLDRELFLRLIKSVTTQIKGLLMPQKVRS